MHYFIDGYNLLFRLHGEIDELRKDRERFLKSFREKVSKLELHVTIVFDGRNQLERSVSAQPGTFETIFTEGGITADEYLLILLKSRSKIGKKLITSDKRLASHARHSGIHTETVEQFLSSINKRFQKYLRHVKNERREISRKDGPHRAAHSTPVKNATFAECFDYYLEIFEGRK